MLHVPVDAVHLDVLEPYIGAERARAFRNMAEDAGRTLAGRAVVNVNSTAAGGGVAEMLTGLLPYARGIGIDVRWCVLEAPPEFFAITKRVHNNIHGVAGDGGELGVREASLYERVLATEREALLAILSAGDLVLLHDPQTLGLAPALRAAGARVVWRCHIGGDHANSWTESGWQFLAPYLDDLDAVVVSRTTFAPPGMDPRRVHVIPPSIDPLKLKNAPLADDLVDRLLVHAGLQQGVNGDAPMFSRRDGSPRRLDRRADVLQLGPPPAAGTPLVVQVSRWDRLKDMAGVMAAFDAYIAGATDAHLLLVGPNVSGVADDPEGAQVLGECEQAWRALPHSHRARVHIVCLPTADVDENAILVNALQRRAAVVTQKSLAEGFGLTVAEAMWKDRPVVASAVGGIVDQIVDGTSGLLVRDAHDLAVFGAAVRGVLDDPEWAHKIGAAAHERARDFLPDVHLARWASMLGELV